MSSTAVSKYVDVMDAVFRLSASLQYRESKKWTFCQRLHLQLLSRIKRIDAYIGLWKSPGGWGLKICPSIQLHI
jgi:hypothetical protein